MSAITCAEADAIAYQAILGIPRRETLMQRRRRFKRRSRIHDGKACNIGRYRPVVTPFGVTIRQGVPANIDVALGMLRRPDLNRRRRSYWQHRLDRYAWHWTQRSLNDIVGVQPMTKPNGLVYSMRYRVGSQNPPRDFDISTIPFEPADPIARLLSGDKPTKDSE